MFFFLFISDSSQWLFSNWSADAMAKSADSSVDKMAATMPAKIALNVAEKAPSSGLHSLCNLLSCN